MNIKHSQNKPSSQVRNKYVLSKNSISPAYVVRVCPLHLILRGLLFPNNLDCLVM